MVRQALQVLLVHRCYEGPAREVRDGHHERVDGLFGSKPGPPQELSSPNADSAVNRVHLDTLPAQPREDACVARSAAHNLGEDCSNSRYRELAASHLGNERSNPVPPSSRPVRYGGDRLAAEEKHQPARRAGPRSP